MQLHNVSDQQLEEILLHGNYITKEDLAKMKEDLGSRKLPLVDYLFSKNLVTKEILGQAIAEYVGVPYSNLDHNRPSNEQILKTPEQLAKQFRMTIFADKKNELLIATDNPAVIPLPELKKIFPNKKISFVYALPEDIDSILHAYRKPLSLRFSEIIKSQKKVASEIFEEILKDALEYKASDIHFEPKAQELLVRFRVDGVLHDAGRLPKEYYEIIINRIKIMARVRIDEHLAPQDGVINFKDNQGNEADLRVSIIPILEGEKVVIRVLSKYVSTLTMETLGLSTTNQERLLTAAKKPFGMILTVGPTGSGKTTTLYTILKTLNGPNVNITTIEDPVEYKIADANQIQVRPETNLTFARGLRSIVRQDPDIILVGEIRDLETAEIAVNAALTGHLLLSTFHANDAATALPRLLDMGVEPFLLSSTLELVLAQRLVRKLCEECRFTVPTTSADIEKQFPTAHPFFKDGEFLLYQSKGCDACRGLGFKGRTSLFELIRITPEMRELILKKPSTQEIWNLAHAQGSTSLFEDGVEKVKLGVTTLEELFRVATPEQHATKSALQKSQQWY